MIVIEKITVVDSIMGSGKTTAMINFINAHKENSYIYVTPYIEQIKRVKEDTDGRFSEPLNLGEGKLKSFHRLMAKGKDIVTTHALFLKATAETIQLIHEGGYTLILDEVLDTFNEYNDIVKSMEGKTVTKKDVGWLKKEKHIIVSKDDYSVEWSGETEGCCFSEIERLAQNGTLRYIDDSLYWEFPKDVFDAFKDIYILTYMFENSILSAYMRLYGFSYNKISAELSDDGTYKLCPYKDDTETKRKLLSLINIYTGHLNEIGDRHNAFSIKWLTGCGSDRIRNIQRCMRSYKELQKASSSDILWTTTKQNNFYEKLERQKGFKYIRRLTAEEKKQADSGKNELRCFVQCAARATNVYSDRTTLMYMINRYIPPEIGKYFSRRGVQLNEKGYALNEMLQWIWRSAVRKGQKINIYIPSSRMRKLLFEWLDTDEPLD